MNGLDYKYFQEKLSLVVRDAKNYTPHEMARELVRLANAANGAECLKEARRLDTPSKQP